MKRLLALLLALAVLLCADLPRQDIHAAGNLATCEAEAIAGSIIIYYCEPDDGPPLYVNSVGFMTVID